jgi:hypothetical protein
MLFSDIWLFSDVFRGIFLSMTFSLEPEAGEYDCGGGADCYSVLAQVFEDMGTPLRWTLEPLN